jgi:3-oxoadipate CoA-transferase beta subunit
MDLAIGAKRTFVMMEHLSKDGQAKLVAECSYPLTARRCVSRVYTDLAVIELGAQPATVIDCCAGLDFAELQARTGIALREADRPAGGAR